MSHFDPSVSSTRSGFSLLEALVSLTIIAAISAVAASALRGPSPKLKLERAISDFSKDIAQTRLSAVNTGRSIEHNAKDCDGRESSLIFHADGTASGGPVCISAAGLSKSINISPLTGRLSNDG